MCVLDEYSLVVCDITLLIKEESVPPVSFLVIVTKESLVASGTNQKLGTRGIPASINDCSVLFVNNNQ